MPCGVVNSNNAVSNAVQSLNSFLLSILSRCDTAARDVTYICIALLTRRNARIHTLHCCLHGRAIYVNLPTDEKIESPLAQFVIERSRRYIRFATVVSCAPQHAAAHVTPHPPAHTHVLRLPAWLDANARVLVAAKGKGRRRIFICLCALLFVSSLPTH
jgi:hypothetical protein